MTSATIRAKLQDYIRIADDKKLKAVNYTPALKSELDRRVTHYLKGGKMVSPADMNKRLQSISFRSFIKNDIQGRNTKSNNLFT